MFTTLIKMFNFYAQKATLFWIKNDFLQIHDSQKKFYNDNLRINRDFAVLKEMAIKCHFWAF